MTDVTESARERRAERRFTLRKRTVFGAVTAAVAVGSIAPAGADNFGSTGAGGSPTNEVSLGNNRWHSWSMHNGDGSWRQGLRDAIQYSYEPTDLVTSEYRDDWNDVDVRVDVTNAGTGLNGWVYCPTDGLRAGADPNESCYRQWLKIDLANTGGFAQDRRKSLMCHEFGHTLGLRHPTAANHPDWLNSCMTRSADNPNRPVALHSHDIDHLNWVY